MTTLAHVGHWAVWALYAAPVLIAVGAVVLSSVRARREDAEANRRRERAGRELGPGAGRER